MISSLYYIVLLDWRCGMNKIKEIKDLSMWQEFAKDIKPLDKNNKAATTPHKKKVNVQPHQEKPNPEMNLRSVKNSEVRVVEGTDFMDKKSLRMLHKGEMKIDARLDLHGMTEAEAFKALNDFIHVSYQKTNKLVLVITGKGMPDNPSIIKYKLPHWLKQENLAPLINRFCQAAKNHGGEGAFYVMLKTRREVVRG